MGVRGVCVVGVVFLGVVGEVDVVCMGVVGELGVVGEVGVSEKGEVEAPQMGL